MERIRPLTAAGGRGAVLVAAVGLSAGCAGMRAATVEKFKHAVAAPATTAKDTAGAPAEKSTAATEFACAWQNRLAQLPDPTKGGAMTPGVVGQVFVYATGDTGPQPTDVNGELTVMVSDTTPRMNGAPPAKPEVWHYTKDVLRRMVVSDERFGRSLVVFLPWPPEWRDVNRLYVQASYQQSNGPTLYAQPTTVTLDFSPTAGQPSPGPGGYAAAGMPGVPDPHAVLRQMQAGGVGPQPPMPPPAGGWGTVPAGFVPPPTPYSPPAAVPPQMPYQPPPGAVPPGGYPQPPSMPQPSAGLVVPSVLPPQWGGPQPPAEGGRVVIPRR